MTRERTTRVVLAAAHLDHDPANRRWRNLRSLCQRCHLAHDRAWHLLQRWVTYRARYARADLFLGAYRHGPDGALPFAEILARIAARLAEWRGAAARCAARPVLAGYAASLPRPDHSAELACSTMDSMLT